MNDMISSTDLNITWHSYQNQTIFRIEFCVNLDARKWKVKKTRMLVIQIDQIHDFVIIIVVLFGKTTGLSELKFLTCTHSY